MLYLYVRMCLRVTSQKPTYVCILYLTRYVCVGALEWDRWTPYFNDRNFAACSMSFKDSSLPWNSSHTAACCSCLLCTSRTSFGWLHTFFRYCRAYKHTVHSYTSTYRLACVCINNVMCPRTDGQTGRSHCHYRCHKALTHNPITYICAVV